MTLRASDEDLILVTHSERSQSRHNLVTVVAQLTGKHGVVVTDNPSFAIVVNMEFPRAHISPIYSIITGYHCASICPSHQRLVQEASCALNHIIASSTSRSLSRCPNSSPSTFCLLS